MSDLTRAEVDRQMLQGWRVRARQEQASKTAIVIDLQQLRLAMSEFVRECAPDDPLAYTIPFETFLQWLRKREETNA